MSDTERIASVLRQAEASRTAVGPVSDLVEGGLTLDLAHDICESTVARREAAGERIAGYKVGFADIGVRESLGLPDPTYGYLMDSRVLGPGGQLARDEFIDPRIECELCLRLGRDLSGPEVTASDAMAAVDAVRGAFEICDSRIVDWRCPYPDILADNAFAARVVLGEGGWRPIGTLDLRSEAVVLSGDGQILAEGRGDLAMGDPAMSVAWLANKLSERGRSLKAGQLVMTGTLTGVLPIEPDISYVASFASLGWVTTTFA